MANSAQSRKRARQNVKAALRNKSRISAMRTEIKKTLLISQAADATQESISKSLNTTLSMIDKNANKNLIHANKAARLKSRLNKKAKKDKASK